MLKSTVVTPIPNQEPLHAGKLKVGELGRAIELYEGQYLLRHYDGVISLSNPGTTWGRDCAVKVVRVPNATVTLTFGSGG